MTPKINTEKQRVSHHKEKLRMKVLREHKINFVSTFLILREKTW